MMTFYKAFIITRDKGLLLGRLDLLGLDIFSMEETRIGVKAEIVLPAESSEIYEKQLFRLRGVISVIVNREFSYRLDDDGGLQLHQERIMHRGRPRWRNAI